jgi:separase
MLSFDLALCKILLAGGINTTFEEAEDVLYYLMDVYQTKGISIAYDEVDMDDMREDYTDALKLFYKESKFKPNDTNYRGIVLIPDKKSNHIPWECLPSLCGKSISRLPSLDYVYEALKSQRTQVGTVNTFAVLNPSQDLSRTQEKFEKIIKKNWNSIIGRAPSRQEFICGLENSSLFLYFGHGGGESYISLKDLEKMSQLPTALLFGCSSGELKSNGELEVGGIALEYLKRGSPAVLGNLWDVTDVDIDAFTLELLDFWGLTSLSQSSLGLSISEARKACKLQYLVGASPVLYGLPCISIK